jgi:threonine dehydrogenase-like Zn-dependent dehydrogenase
MKLGPLFGTNVGLRGGVAPVRNYVDELLPEVLDGRLKPGAVFDLELPLSEVAAGYVAMDERRAIKVLLRP